MFKLSPTVRINRPAAIRFFAIIFILIAVAAYAFSKAAHSCDWQSGAEPSYRCAVQPH